MLVVQGVDFLSPLPSLRFLFCFFFILPDYCFIIQHLTLRISPLMIPPIVTSTIHPLFHASNVCPLAK